MPAVQVLTCSLFCLFVEIFRLHRTRDCESIDFLLFVKTGPIIETSRNLRLSCFDFNYPELRGENHFFLFLFLILPKTAQFLKAKLNPFVNFWSAIHDFSPKDGNYGLFSRNELPEQFLKAVPEVPVDENQGSLVPITFGENRPKPFGQVQ
jgi:hypothetical protein